MNTSDGMESGARYEIIKRNKEKEEGKATPHTREDPGQKPRAISLKNQQIFFYYYFLTCQASALDMAKVG